MSTNSFKSTTVPWTIRRIVRRMDRTRRARGTLCSSRYRCANRESISMTCLSNLKLSSSIWGRSRCAANLNRPIACIGRLCEIHLYLDGGRRRICKLRANLNRFRMLSNREFIRHMTSWYVLRWYCLWHSANVCLHCCSVTNRDSFGHYHCFDRYCK